MSISLFVEQKHSPFDGQPRDSVSRWVWRGMLAVGDCEPPTVAMLLLLEHGK